MPHDHKHCCDVMPSILTGTQKHHLTRNSTAFSTTYVPSQVRNQKALRMASLQDAKWQQWNQLHTVHPLSQV